MAKSYAALALGLALASPTALPAEPADAAQNSGVPFTWPSVAGQLADPRNREASGLAASRRSPELLWIHEDSGGAPQLYALTPQGARAGLLVLRGVANRDWEDLASFTHDGQAWLCVADVGDNAAIRPHVLLHLVPEPDPVRLAATGGLELAPTATLKLTYEDGPRDCESVAVDPREGAIYLLSKRDGPPQLYRVPLQFTSGSVVARRVGAVPHLPQPNALQSLVPSVTGQMRGFPCAMDFAADGSAALVLTYGDLCYFARAPQESWAEALGREPTVLPAHGLPQAEAAAFSADGRAIYVASEASPQLLRYDRR